MSSQYEIAIIGASLDGLIAATYLAKTGRSVVVLELHEIGGSHRTVEFSKGFHAPAAVDSIDELHPSIVQDLDLLSHGLEILKGGGHALLDSDGISVHMDASGRATSRIPLSDSDQESLAEFRAFLLEVSGALTPAMTQPLADPTIDRFSGLADLMHLGWALRRLGRKTMPEALRYLPTNVYDVANERFESNALKTLLAAEAIRGTRMAPRTEGSAFSLLNNNSHWMGGLGHPVRFSAGGPGALSQALASSARAAGVNIQLDANVATIGVTDERAHHVLLSEGTVIEAGTVVSTLDPRTTLLELVGPKLFQPDFVEKVTQIRGRGALSILRLALDGLPVVAGQSTSDSDTRAVFSGRITIGRDMNDFERAYDAVKYGEIPERPFVTFTIPSLTDPSLAPEGKHVMNVWIQFTPYDIRDGKYADHVDALQDRVIGMLEEVMPGITQSVLHAEILSPPEIESEFGVDQGCLEHVEMSLDQILYMRPIPGWFRYRTPIDGLYICGPGTHPGGQSGLSGKCAAQQIAQDLK